MDVPLETQYTEIHRQLIELVDQVTLEHHKRSIDDVNAQFAALLDQLDPMVFTHLNKSSTDVQDIQNLNQFLRQLLRIKNLVYEHTLMTAPVLKSVNEAISITDFEKQIKPKIDTRDELSSEYILLNREYAEVSRSLIDAQRQLAELVADTKTNLDMLPVAETRKFSKNTKTYQRLRPKLRELKTVKKRVSILEDLVVSLITAANVNWSRDEYIKKIILLCGTPDAADSEMLADALEQVTSGEEESDYDEDV